MVVVTQDVRETNRSMVERILGMPVEQPEENGYVLRVLQTRGRRSGAARRTPMAVVRHGGRDHLVTPDPSRDWAQNLLADPAAEVADADGSRPVLARVVGPDDGAPVVSAYLTAMTVPWAVRAFPVAPGAPLDEIRAHMDSIAVFRLESR